MQLQIGTIRALCWGAAGETGMGQGSPQLFPLPRKVPPWPVASAAPALQPISRLPSMLIIFIAGGSWGAGCGEPGAGTGVGGGIWKGSHE